MGQRLQFCQVWRGGRGERLWLSALVDTMERVSQASAEPCDARTLAALRAQLALPAQPAFASRIKLLN